MSTKVGEDGTLQRGESLKRPSLFQMVLPACCVLGTLTTHGFQKKRTPSSNVREKEDKKDWFKLLVCKLCPTRYL